MNDDIETMKDRMRQVRELLHQHQQKQLCRKHHLLHAMNELSHQHLLLEEMNEVRIQLDGLSVQILRILAAADPNVGARSP